MYHLTVIDARQNNAPPELIEGGLRFRITPRAESRSSNGDTQAVLIPHFNEEHDPEGVASHVPHMQLFYDNSLQTGLMRDMAIDLELLGEHLVLLGNQVCLWDEPRLFNCNLAEGGPSVGSREE